MSDRVAILSTGDELTTGRTTDTNANFVADKLTAVGFDVIAILTVGDYPERLRWAWSQAMDVADFVISTGGLGPTADDLTTETVAGLLDKELFLDQDSADRIRGLFTSMGREMPENNLKQAQFPVDSTIISNRLGTAPGFRIQAENGGSPRHLVVMPGVPREMKVMLEEEVLPWIQQQQQEKIVNQIRVFQTFGISESALDELVTGCVPEEEGRLAFRAAFPQISLRLTVSGDDTQATTGKLDILSQQLRDRLGDYLYGEGDVTMESVTGDRLRDHGRTVAVAESCTGGLVGHRLSDVPGSSEYFRGGIVAYSNEVKHNQLEVPRELLESHGAVSEEVAQAMAQGARKNLHSDIGVATTGIAGPGGGTKEKPVGTVCVALADADRVFSRKYQLWGTRDWIKLLSSQIALDWIRRYLLDRDPTQSGVLRK